MDRLVLRAAWLIPLANFVVLWALAGLGHPQLALAIGGVEFGLFLIGVAGLLVYFRLAGRWATTPEGAAFRVAITDRHLTMHQPGPHGALVLDVDLTAVRHVHWYVSYFSRQHTVRITLWDRWSTFTLVGIDEYPDDPDARLLGWFRGPDLLLQPAEHRRFIEHFEPLVLSGQVTTTVDLETLQPTHPNVDRVAPGWIAFEDRLMYWPKLADTERRLRAEKPDWD